MRRLDSYLVISFLTSFLPMFLMLFSVGSMVLIMRLADMTAIVRLNAGEFFQLYAFTIPQLFFYTLPISFFVALSVTVSKLSFDGELTAIIALGAGKKSVTRPFVYISLFLSAVLLFLGLFATIQCVNDAKRFIETKKASSKLNLQANSVGQKFGDWFVFALKEDASGNYNDIVLYSKEFKSQFFDSSAPSGDKIIFAKTAKVMSESGTAALSLGLGTAVMTDESSSLGKIKKIEFEKMLLRDEKSLSLQEETSVFEYWLKGLDDKKRAKDFADVVLTSLTPIFNILLAFAFGVARTRGSKNSAVAYTIGSIALFYLLVLSISPLITFYAIPVVSAIWLALVWGVYKTSAFARL
jgi:lipopolysaccharide export system permease protein